MRKIKNYIPVGIKRLLKKMIKITIYGFPVFDSVVIEISGACNANCRWCITGRTPMLERSQFFMTPDLFSKIIKRISNEKMILPRSTLALYSWGEPVLNPHLSDLCEIAGQYHFKVGISTNASRYVELSECALRNIGYVHFSVSGMTQETYGRIHGFDVISVLKNIQQWCKTFDRMKIKAPRTMVFHVYKFNHTDISEARAFCSANSIDFFPYYAYFNDWERSLAYLEQSLPTDIKEQATQELELFYVKDHIAQAPQNYRCPQFNNLVIDETGQLLTCCVVPRGHPNYSLGHFLDMSLPEILEAKRSQQCCIKCLNLGAAWWVNDVMPYKNIHEE
ncbi:MAG: radical SAM protein [Synergistaceae bacterium]|nr:radical SAM protein [Synergistaceae bacterium]